MFVSGSFLSLVTRANVRLTTLSFTPSVMDVAIVLLFFARYSDKLKLCLSFTLSGPILRLARFPTKVSDASNGAEYSGTFLCVVGSYATYPVIVAW